MYILPINNRSEKYNTSFHAKVSKKDVNLLLKEIEGNDIDILPQLYTMLDYVKELPAKTVKIVKSDFRPWYKMKVSGADINGGNEYICAFHALKDLTVKHKNSIIKDNSLSRMSEEEFEASYYKNSKKTKQDVLNIFA